MAKFEVLTEGLAMLSFAEFKKPEVFINKQHDFVQWGLRNDFPQEIIRFYDEHAEHGAIVSAKAKYLWGKGLKAKNKEQEQVVTDFLDALNRFDTADSFGEKFCLDDELFNSTYIQVISDLSGRPVEFFHLQNANCRLSKCGKWLYYSEDWLCDRWHLKYTTYPIYNPNSNEKQIGTTFLRFKHYQPAANKLKSVYPLPPYKGCMSEIKSDIDITTFHSNHVLNGFSAGTIITFFNGEPDVDQKKHIRQSFINRHTSPDQAGSVIIGYTDKEGKPPEVAAIPSDDLASKFDSISKRYQQKILTGHNVVNPELFGIKTEGQLGNRVSIKDSHELFINTYTKPRQQTVIEFFEYMMFIKTGQWVEMEFEQLDPIGYDLLDANSSRFVTVDEGREILGLKVSEDVKTQAQVTNDAINSLSPLVANKVLESMTEDEIRGLASLPPKAAVLNPDGTVATNADGTPVIIQESAVNDNIKNLTGKQMQHMNRIAKQYRDGKLNDAQAMLQLKGGFGLSDEDAKAWLGIEEPIRAVAPVKMSSQAAEFLITQFSAIDTNDGLNLELLSEEDVHIHNSADAIKHEMSVHLKFADSPGFIESLIGNIKTLIGSNPKGESGKSPEYKTEIITKYKYALKAGALPASSGSRPFCQKMMALSEQGKEFTFEQIDQVRVAGLKNGMPEVDNIWDFRGGFYTNPQTNETDPFCRHIWKAKTYKVKTKV